MDGEPNSSESGSTDEMMNNILSSIHQPPSSSSSSSSSSWPTDEILREIETASKLPESSSSDVRLSEEDGKESKLPVSSSPDFSLSEEDKKEKIPLPHLQQYHQLVRTQYLVLSSSEESEYEPPMPALEDRQLWDLNLGSEDGEEERGLRDKLG